MLRLATICLAILPYAHAFSVTLPMAGSSLQEGDSFTVGWILGPLGPLNINLVTGTGEPYTTVASLKTGVSGLQLLTSVTIPDNVPAGAYYIQVGDAPNDAIGGPYKVTVDPKASFSSIPTALSSTGVSSIATASISSASANISSSSVPLSSSASLTSSSTPSGSTSSTPSATSSSTDSLNTNSNSADMSLQKSSSSNNGGMIGGIVGGIAAIILIPGSFLLWRRNKKRQQQQEMSNAVFWDQPPAHDHDDGPSWGYPSSLKYSNSPGPGSYDPGLHQDNMTPYSHGYYDNYNMPAAAAIGGMHTPPPAAIREEAMAGAYYNSPYPIVDNSKFQENEKIHLADEIQATQKPHQM
ncbi:hypothetical protein INT43_004729 [Umbelopsis isabellina]|uniref:Mid2 domain-containing protein n=1 Tax=Mortierella isabellina TaxID=91625 RepID=A0A8H7PGC2_MORIS|nr:hypothetical protein INT43_004729 [Umbelopsis isabellina]